MKLEPVINFNGNCREAVEFYAKVFRTEVEHLMTYGEAPPDPNHPLPEADKDRIMYAGMPFGGMVMMFMDYPSNSPLTVGDHIHLTISTEDKDEVTRLFNELKEGGTALAALSATFFSGWYGMVRDKFGVTWQILQYLPDA